MHMLGVEQWKAIDGTDSLYGVSTHGRVRSVGCTLKMDYLSVKSPSGSEWVQSQLIARLLVRHGVIFDR